MKPMRCDARESGGAQCEKTMGHRGSHACPQTANEWARNGRDLHRAIMIISHRLKHRFRQKVERVINEIPF